MDALGKFLPHGDCFHGAPGLLWWMVGADGLIALAYFSVPLAVGSFIYRRAGASVNGIAWLFCAFVFASGITHVMDIWTIWSPDYGVRALTKVTTAGISIVMAVALWPLIPKALRIPSVSEQQSVIDKLTAEAEMRRHAEDLVDDISRDLAATLDSIGAGFISADQLGFVTRLNTTAERFTGWTNEEAGGQSLWHVLRREGRPASMELLNPLDVIIDRGDSMDVTYDIVAIGRDGRHTALQAKATVTKTPDGRGKGLVVVLRDLSEIDRLQAENARLAAIVKCSGEAIISKTLDGKIASWNDAAELLLGYSPQEMLGQSDERLIPREHQFEGQAVVASLARGESVEPFDTVRRAKSGQVIEVSIAVSPIRDSSGKVIGAAESARDITLRRWTEGALRATEAKLRFTLEVAHVGDWELDTVTGFATCSLRHDQCFGYTEPQTDWTASRFLGHIFPDDRERVASGMELAGATGKDWHTECRVVWPDLSVHWIEISGGVYRHAGANTRMLGVVVDTTAQRLAEGARVRSRQLEAENLQALESNRLKSLFLANMSHELRTPMTAIIGFADLLQGSMFADHSPQRQVFLGHIATSGRHLLRLINDILDLSKVEAGKFEFFPEPFNIKEAVDEIKEILLRTLSRKHVKLNVQVDSLIAVVTLDPGRFKQILYNYLSNAIKFSPDDGAITVRALQAGPRHFRLEVEDQGIGISTVDLPRLFTEFQQLDSGSTKQFPGTGLGLALVRRLAEAQGGMAGASSMVGVGSVFYVTLPRMHRNAAAPAGVATERRLLVIEDDTVARSHHVDSLRQQGFVVDVASDDIEAKTYALQHDYDAMTLDLMLPTEGHGLGALKDIRDLLRDHEAPVINLSMPVGLEQSAVFAITDVLPKPLRNDELLIAMARLRRDGSTRLKVLVIDDDQVALDLMQAMLASIGVSAVCEIDAVEALRTIDDVQPDAVVLDLMMPEFDGFQTLYALRQREAYLDLPVFIWTNMTLSAQEYSILARSAATIAYKVSGHPTDGTDVQPLRTWEEPSAFGDVG